VSFPLCPFRFFRSRCVSFPLFPLVSFPLFRSEQALEPAAWLKFAVMPPEFITTKIARYSSNP
jgi:hypothetical protein